eukprot:Skav232747  [mRNA]  locus=scaffold4478:76599:85334:- [translate_table: standard]
MPHPICDGIPLLPSHVALQMLDFLALLLQLNTMGFSHFGKRLLVGPCKRVKGVRVRRPLCFHFLSCPSSSLQCLIQSAMGFLCFRVMLLSKCWTFLRCSSNSTRWVSRISASACSWDLVRESRALECADRSASISCLARVVACNASSNLRWDSSAS